MKFNLSFIVGFCFCACITKAQLVLNDGIIVNVNGGTSGSPATIVLNNPPATPVSRLGTITSQGIMLESEYNRVQYNLDQGTTSIVIPYISNTTGSWVPFPLTVYGITAGVRAAGKTGAIRFSSTKAATLATGWDDYTYKPSQVLNVCGNPMGTCVNNSNVNDNSANVVDRFWIIEPVYYNSAAQRPAVTLDFTYIMEETDINGGNTAALANALQPQRFDTINTGSAIWGWNGFPSTAAETGVNTVGTMNATGVGTVTSVSVSAANFFPDWTLASKLIVLPVSLLDFKADCENGSTTLSWTTATEQNSGFYTIEKSGDGTNFTVLATVNAIGNSNQNTAYAYVDIEPAHCISYYRLSETDKNGKVKIFDKLIVSNCASGSPENGNLYAYHNEVYLNLFSLSNQQVAFNAYDVTGRLIYKNELLVNEGFNHVKIIPSLAQGIYLFEMVTNKITITKKILIEN